MVLGLGLGGYSYTYRKTEKDTASDCNFQLENGEGFADSLQEGRELLNGILFARDMVNTPGNHLRPMDYRLRGRRRCGNGIAGIRTAAGFAAGSALWRGRQQ